MGDYYEITEEDTPLHNIGVQSSNRGLVIGGPCHGRVCATPEGMRRVIVLSPPDELPPPRLRSWRQRWFSWPWRPLRRYEAPDGPIPLNEFIYEHERFVFPVRDRVCRRVVTVSIWKPFGDTSAVVWVNLKGLPWRSIREAIVEISESY